MHTLHPRNPRGHCRKSGIVAQLAHLETRSSDFTTSQRDTTRTVGDEGHAATRLRSPPSSLPHNSQRHRSTQDIVGRCQPRCCVSPAHGQAQRNHHLQDDALKRGGDEDRRRRPTLHSRVQVFTRRGGPRLRKIEELQDDPPRGRTTPTGVASSCFRSEHSRLSSPTQPGQGGETRGTAVLHAH